MVDTAKTARCTYCGRVYPWHECTVIGMTANEESAARAALDAVTADRPAVLLYPVPDPTTGKTGDGGQWYCGVFQWRTPDDWIVAVYNDCGEWDYLEWIESPDGQRWNFPLNGQGRTITHAMTESLKDWQPAHANELGWPGIEHCSP